MADTVLKTRFIPPQLQEDVWIGEELEKKMAESGDYPLTMITAGPGCGKTTLLAGYFKGRDNFAWYSLDEFDEDPGVFLRNLLAAVSYDRGDLSYEAHNHLQNVGEQTGKLQSALDLFLNELLENLQNDYYLILDDIHLLSEGQRVITLLNYLISNLPPRFHIILAGRYQPEFPDLLNWQLKNRVHIIDGEDFALSENEIKEFLELRHGCKPGPEQANKIYSITEGWTMAVDLLGRSVDCSRDGALRKLAAAPGDSLEIIFAYLTDEVMSDLTPSEKDFLYKTSFLQEINTRVCQRLSPQQLDGVELMERLAEHSLFVKKYSSDQYRFHHLFRDFLQNRAEQEYSPEDMHNQAADIMEDMEKNRWVIYHLLQAEAYGRAAEKILKCADSLLQAGQVEVLQGFLDEIPEEIFHKNPRLFLHQGDIYRIKNDFNGALTLYREAEDHLTQNPRNRAEEDREGDESFRLEVLKRLALVYLDTVQPNLADEYLQKVEKIRLEDSSQSEAELLRLMAENKINEGHFEEAEKYRRKAEQISQDIELENNLGGRVQLRTGRLKQALTTLDDEEQKREGSAWNMPRSHRETVLLRSLIYSFLGRSQKALDQAERGLELVQDFTSPFTEAVARMRRGHALQLRDGYSADEARSSYQRALNILEEIDLRRGRCEPLMGLALLEAFYGDRNLGERYAREGKTIAREAGDEWLKALLSIALGINRFQQDKLVRAREDLQAARRVSQDTYDLYSRAICNYWLTIINHQEDKHYRCQVTLHELLDLLSDNDLMELIEQKTLFTARDPDRIVPVLLSARDGDDNSPVGGMEQVLSSLLAELGYSGLERHPGYTLRISAFGRCQFYRGWEEISADEWQREKARRLLLLFLVHRGEMISRDRICSILWPDSDLESARSNFKVTLNSLKKTLEPDREPRQDPYFINRRKGYYGLNEEASYYYDVEEFERLISRGKGEELPSEAVEYFQKAVDLYQGDFLAEETYLDFVREERESLRNKYLTAQNRIIEHFFQREKYERCIEHCNQALKIDICWERAYYFLMRCYRALGRRTMALKTYSRCRQILQERMDLKPGRKIEELRDKLKS